jgi:serine/tyrosine/threonine adenylyltransferase
MKNSGWNLRQSYAELPSEFFSVVRPTPVSRPQVVVLNTPLAELLGVPFLHPADGDAAQLLSGNKLPDGAQPLAQAYAGHQFGHFTLLGDGRAILLGEQTSESDRVFDIQFKGSGPTPYSRRGDGRAALGPMLREYIVSEAMASLEIPTTRSLAVTLTGEQVMRESLLPGAVLTRVAASHIRVGTFEYAAALGDPARLAELTLYTLNRHLPDFPEDVPPALSLLNYAVRSQAALIARWMQVGFIHGVMNTDNMALSGETIDYGPCAFMDVYHPQTVFSSIDTQGRYAFAQQPQIALWNLERFAETLLPILAEEKEEAIELAHSALDGFAELYNHFWLSGMAAKVGFANSSDDIQKLVLQLLQVMQRNELDYTNTFTALTRSLSQADPERSVSDELCPNLEAWRTQWLSLLQQQGVAQSDAAVLMGKVNPTVIPRNHRVHAALEAAEARGDFAPLHELLSVLANPFGSSELHNNYAKAPEPHERVRATFCGT